MAMKIMLIDGGMAVFQWNSHSLVIKSTSISTYLFVCVEVLRPSQPCGVMSSAVGLPNHTFTGQA